MNIVLAFLMSAKVAWDSLPGVFLSAMIVDIAGPQAGTSFAFLSVLAVDSNPVALHQKQEKSHHAGLSLGTGLGSVS